MAGRFNVDTSSLAYGSVGGAGARAMQTEILRRLQQQEAEAAEASRQEEIRLTRERQARIDAEAARSNEVNRRVAEENIALSRLTREGAEEERQQRMRDKDIAAFQNRMSVGADLTPEDITEAKRLNLGGLILKKKGEAKPGVVLPLNTAAPTAPMKPEDVGPEAPPAMPQGNVTLPSMEMEPDSYKWAGTTAQQKEASDRDALIAQRQFTQDFVDGKYDDMFEGVAPKQLAGLKLMARTGATGMGTVMASMFRNAQETAAQHNLAMEALGTKQRMGQALTPEEQAQYTEWSSRKPTQEQRQNDRLVILDRTNQNASGRQEDAQTTTARGRLISDLDDDAKLLKGKATAAEQLIEAAKSGGVNDSTLMTAFIQMRVGGYGSGLRLSDFETKLVQNTMTAVERLQSGASLLGIPGFEDIVGKPHLVSQRLREQMAKSAQDIIAASRRRLAQINDAETDAINAQSERQVHLARRAYNQAFSDDLEKAPEKTAPNTPAAPTAPPAGRGKPGVTSSVIR